MRKIDGIEFLPAQNKDKEKGAQAAAAATAAGPSDAAAAAAASSAPKALRKAYGSKSGTTICAVAAPMGVASTSGAQPGPSDEKSLIEKKLSLRKKKEQAPLKDTPLNVQTSKSGAAIGASPRESADEQAKKTANAVAAAFSTQNVGEDTSEKQKPPLDRKASGPGGPFPKAPQNPAVGNLLAQLALPPSVSAKVDKIIASGDKAKVRKPSGQQVRAESFNFFILKSYDVSKPPLRVHRTFC